MPALEFDGLYPVEHHDEPPDYTYYNPVIYEMWCFIADKIERDPALLSIPLSNMERWIKQGISSQKMLLLWKPIIEFAQVNDEGLKKLCNFLRSDSEESRHMKGYDPFVGIMTKQEKRQFQWTWDH